MALTFLCPNGHRLSCADEQAGLAGQCPECGVRFRIPLPEQPDDGATAREESVDNGEAATEQAVEEEAVPQPAPERIVFLCPNGHRLFGPPHLAGRAGQCPHCGAKFRIPPLEEAPADGEMFESVEDEAGGEEYAGEEVAGQVDHAPTEPYEGAAHEGAAQSEGAEQYEGTEQHDSYESVEEYDAEPSANGSAEYVEEFVEELVEDVGADAGDAADDDESTSGAIWPGAGAHAAAKRRGGDDFLGFGATTDVEEDDTAFQPSATSAADLPHPMAELCDRLWAETGSGAKIEVVLADGNHLVVHHFARNWSQRSHGLFACREGDGTYTLTAVAWETISRVIVRGVPELSEDLV